MVVLRVFVRFLRFLAPASVAYHDRARILAAMEGDPSTPVSTSLGEGGVETGQTTTVPTSLGAGGNGGGGAASERPVPVETPGLLLSWGEQS